MYKIILHATDLSENHFSACKKAVNLAKAMNAKIYFLHVIEMPNTFQWAQSLGFAELATPVTDGAKTVMSTLADAFSIPASHCFVEVGSAYTHILEKVKELHCDLVILGSHTSSAAHFETSTAHALLNHANCDLLSLRN